MLDVLFKPTHLLITMYTIKFEFFKNLIIMLA